MKYIVSVLCVVGLILTFAFCGLKQNTGETEYLRIHIRANSNYSEDQEVKYMVKDAIVTALTPLLKEAKTKQQAEEILTKNNAYIVKIAEKVLEVNGFNYGAKAEIRNEYFPTRSYENLTLESGNYDALIVELGSGKGDNWWCVVYPAFCFLNSKNSQNSGYISKIWEIIKSVTNR